MQQSTFTSLDALVLGKLYWDFKPYIRIHLLGRNFTIQFLMLIFMRDLQCPRLIMKGEHSEFVCLSGIRGDLY